MNTSGVHDPDEEIRFQLQRFLDKLGLMSQDTGFMVEQLNRALSAAKDNFGSPDRLIIDPKAFEALKNISFDPKHLKP